MSKPWYALHVASNCESQVTDRLDQAGIESFYPFVSVKSRDKRRDVQRKFFPGYVFARFDLADRTPVLLCHQVIRILGWGGNLPAQIPEAQVAAVRLMTQSALASLASGPYVAAGQTVIIQRGPLQGLEGFVTQAKPGKARITVSVTMLNRSLSAQVDLTDCEVQPESPVNSTSTPLRPAA